MADQDANFSTTVLERTFVKPQEKLKRPSMYGVILLNDDFTPRAFVVHVLQKYFSKNETEAIAIMNKAHLHERSLVAIYPFSIAETKAFRANEYAKENVLPLRFTIEAQT